jgi:hypothetical protein
VSLGLVVFGLVAGVTAAVPESSAGASTIKSNKPYAKAQLLKLSDLPNGWTKNGSVWVGTSADNDSSSMFTMTQYPDYSTCLGKPPALSIVAAEASSPDFNSEDGNIDVFDVADVYTSAEEAKSDFPPFDSPKFAKCFLQEQSSYITQGEQSQWPTGATFGTPTASVSHQAKYGDQSGLLEIQVPVTLPAGQGTSNDFLVALVIRHDRSVAELLIDQGKTLPSAALTGSLAKKLIARMKAPPPHNTIITALDQETLIALGGTVNHS